MAENRNWIMFFIICRLSVLGCSNLKVSSETMNNPLYIGWDLLDFESKLLKASTYT